jgi:hypothetical protein
MYTHCHGAIYILNIAFFDQDLSRLKAQLLDFSLADRFTPLELLDLSVKQIIRIPDTQMTSIDTPIQIG